MSRQLCSGCGFELRRGRSSCDQCGRHTFVPPSDTRTTPVAPEVSKNLGMKYLGEYRVVLQEIIDYIESNDDDLPKAYSSYVESVWRSTLRNFLAWREAGAMFILRKDTQSGYGNLPDFMDAGVVKRGKKVEQQFKYNFSKSFEIGPLLPLTVALLAGHIFRSGLLACDLLRFAHDYEPGRTGSLDLGASHLMPRQLWKEMQDLGLFLGVDHVPINGELAVIRACNKVQASTICRGIAVRICQETELSFIANQSYSSWTVPEVEVAGAIVFAFEIGYKLSGSLFPNLSELRSSWLGHIGICASEDTLLKWVERARSILETYGTSYDDEGCSLFSTTGLTSNSVACSKKWPCLANRLPESDLVEKSQTVIAYKNQPSKLLRVWELPDFVRCFEGDRVPLDLEKRARSLVLTVVSGCMLASTEDVGAVVDKLRARFECFGNRQKLLPS